MNKHTNRAQRMLGSQLAFLATARNCQAQCPESISFNPVYWLRRNVAEQLAAEGSQL